MRTLTLLPAIIALSTTLPQQAGAQVDMNKMLQGRMGGAQVQDDNDPFVPNTFIGSFTMETHTMKNGAEDRNSPMSTQYWSNTDMVLMQTAMPDAKGQDMKMMTDLKGKWQYMLMTDDKGKKTAMKSHKKKFTMKEDPKKAAPEVIATNETKTIEGHLCKKVIVKSEDGTWTGWVAEEIPTPFADMMRSMKGGDPAMMERMNQVKGMPLEYEWVSTDGKQTIHCYFRDVVVGTVDASVFSLDGYEVMEMPSFGQ